VAGAAGPTEEDYVKYLVLIYTDESQMDAVTPQDTEKVMGEYIAYSQELFGTGVALGGEALQPSSTATTVRVRDGERLVTDGPFAEAREQLGGFYLLEVADLDAALEWAAKCPGARYGSVEVRPVLDFGNPSA
jgi:hypothetical protein